MSCRGGIGARAPGALAVHRQTLGARGITAEQVGQAAGAHQRQHPADRGGGRGPAHAERPERPRTQPGQGVLRRARRPLPDSRIGTGTGQNRTAGCEQHRYQRMPPAPPATRIDQHRQPACHRGQSTLFGGGRLDQTDRGRLTAHRSSGGSGRLGKVIPDNRSFVASDTASPPRPPDLHNHVITKTLNQPWLLNRTCYGRQLTARPASRRGAHRGPDRPGRAGDTGVGLAPLSRGPPNPDPIARPRPKWPRHIPLGGLDGGLGEPIGDTNAEESA